MKRYFSVFHIMRKIQKFLIWPYRLHSCCELNECDGVGFNWAGNWDGIKNLRAPGMWWQQDQNRRDLTLPIMFWMVSHNDENASSVSIEATIHSFVITQLASFFVCLFVYFHNGLCLFYILPDNAVSTDNQNKFQSRPYWRVLLNTILSDLKRSVD